MPRATAHCPAPSPMPSASRPAPNAPHSVPRAKCPARNAPREMPRTQCPTPNARAQCPASTMPREGRGGGEGGRSPQWSGLCGRRPTAHRPPGGACGGRAVRRFGHLRLGARYPSEEPLASGVPAEAEPAAARASAGAPSAPTFAVWTQPSAQHRASVELIPSVGAPSVVGHSFFLRGFDSLAEIGLGRHLPGSRWPGSSCSSPVRV